MHTPPHVSPATDLLPGLPVLLLGLVAAAHVV